MISFLFVGVMRVGRGMWTKLNHKPPMPRYHRRITFHGGGRLIKLQYNICMVIKLSIG